MGPVRWSAVQCNGVQCSAVQFSTVQYSTVQYSTVHYNTVQYLAVAGFPVSRVMLEYFHLKLTPGAELQTWGGWEIHWAQGPYWTLSHRVTKGLRNLEPIQSLLANGSELGAQLRN